MSFLGFAISISSEREVVPKRRIFFFFPLPRHSESVPTCAIVCLSASESTLCPCSPQNLSSRLSFAPFLFFFFFNLFFSSLSFSNQPFRPVSPISLASLPGSSNFSSETREVPNISEEMSSARRGLKTAPNGLGDAERACLLCYPCSLCVLNRLFELLPAVTRIVLRVLNAMNVLKTK